MTSMWNPTWPTANNLNDDIDFTKANTLARVDFDNLKPKNLNHATEYDIFKENSISNMYWTQDVWDPYTVKAAT